MAISIGANIAAQQAQRRLAESSSAQRAVFERLSSGLRINKGSDDAAGLAVSSSLNKDVRVYTQAIRNGNDAISALSVAEGTLNEFTGVLTRLQELATQASNSPFSRTQRVSLDVEGKALTDEFNRLAASTSFNKINLLDGQLGSLSVQLGFGTDASISFALGAGLSRNRGTGFSSSSATVLSATDGAGAIVQGDFNGDGNLDIVTFNSGGANELYVALGRGDGTFQAQSTVSGLIGSYSTAAAGDVNGDGKLDLVAGTTGAVVVFTGDGSGGFSTGTSYSTGVNSNTSIFLNDLNSDGKLDIVGVSGSTAATIFNQGGGVFGNGTSYSFFSTLSSVSLVDINGDGILDIAGRAGSGVTRYLSTRLGTVGGGFGAEQRTALSSSASSIAFGDFNYDGLVDAAVTRGSSADIYNGKADGTFSQSGTTLSLGASPSVFRSADFDGDGILDLVVSTSQNLRILNGIGNGTFNGPVNSGTIAGLATLSVIGDYNNDGVNDVAGLGFLAGTVVSVRSTTATTTSIQRLNLTTRDAALGTLSLLDAVRQRVSTELSNIGGAQSRIYTALQTLSSTRENSAAAASRITDADVAEESANGVRLAILQQLGASVLAQSTQSQGLVLTLLGR